MYTYENLNQALIGLSKTLLDEGYWTHRKGKQMLEMTHPITVCITNPSDRYVTVPGRRWNRFLPFVESLWMALGLNDLTMLGHYMKKAYEFSDDGRTWRGGYGPRIRAFSGIATDYHISDPGKRQNAGGHVTTVDQLKYVVEKLQEDPTSRQAVIQIGDPVKDHFDIDGSLKQTKDYPCSRTLQFIRNPHGALDCTLYIRSNDLYWGFSAVNASNFMLMLEYVAGMTGMPVGNYYHIANNLHVYDEFVPKLELFENFSTYDFPTGERFIYNDTFKGISHFDSSINGLYMYEALLRMGETDEDIDFDSDMITDWAKVLLKYHRPDLRLKFKNPYLQRLFYMPDDRWRNKQYVAVTFPHQPMQLFPVDTTVASYRRGIKEANHKVIDVGKTDKYGRL